MFNFVEEKYKKNIVFAIKPTPKHDKIDTVSTVLILFR